MKRIHFKLSISIVLLLIQGCATNDSNSLLVRWWNDGFIYSEKKAEISNICSQVANSAQSQKDLNDDQWYEIYIKCMKKKGY